MGAFQSWWACGGDFCFNFLSIDITTPSHLVIFEEMFTVEQDVTVVKNRLEYDEEQDDLNHHSGKLDL